MFNNATLKFFASVIAVCASVAIFKSSGFIRRRKTTTTLRPKDYYNQFT